MFLHLRNVEDVRALPGVAELDRDLSRPALRDLFPRQITDEDGLLGHGVLSWLGRLPKAEVTVRLADAVAVPLGSVGAVCGGYPTV